MSANTKIEWADHTFNPWIGCTKVSPGCDNCYASVSTPAHAKAIQWGAGQARQRTTSTWANPIAWEKRGPHFRACADCCMRWHAHSSAGKERCPKCGSKAIGLARQRVFCASLADVFDNAVPVEWRRDLFTLILNTPHLDWLLLTKRIGNAARMINEVLPANMKALPPDCPVAWPWPNVWIGATVVNQAEADRDIPKLLQVPAAKHFLSMEPLLGPVNLADISDGHADSTIPREYWEDGFDTDDSPPAVGHNCLTGERWQRFGDWNEYGPSIDWVIVGGESGRGARPMHPDWARSLRDQCQEAGVPFFFKQWGAWLGARQDGAHDHEPIELNATDESVRVGKKAAGRLLDGRTWDEVPG